MFNSEKPHKIQISLDSDIPNTILRIIRPIMILGSILTVIVILLTHLIHKL